MKITKVPVPDRPLFDDWIGHWKLPGTLVWLEAPVESEWAPFLDRPVLIGRANVFGNCYADRLGASVLRDCRVVAHAVIPLDELEIEEQS